MRHHSAYIELAIDSFSVKLSHFINEALPRITADGEEDVIERTAAHSTVVYGTSAPQANLWNISAFCSREDYTTLKLIQATSRAKRLAGHDPAITINDRTELYEEIGPPTKPLVPNTTVIDRSPFSLYYAQFRGFMSRKPTAVKTGYGLTVECTLIEV